MLSEQGLLEMLRDMILENGNSYSGWTTLIFTDTLNENLLKPSKLVETLRFRKDHSQLSAMITLFLSPISKFNPHLPKAVFSAAQRAVYVPSAFPLFDSEGTPNFLLILSIIKFFQHHLDHMRHHIGPVTRQALSWHTARVAGSHAFQPGPHVTRSNFDNDPSKIEGNWIGLYSYLGWADFEALRDGNPAVLEANRDGHLRDYLGGPQQLIIRIPKTEDTPQLTAHEGTSIDITGEGINGGSFIFKGRLRRVYLPSSIFGADMHLYWRITFVKTYANGENSWTRWIYDGIYCPGIVL
jgi:hypothetical protein